MGPAAHHVSPAALEEFAVRRDEVAVTFAVDVAAFAMHGEANLSGLGRQSKCSHYAYATGGGGERQAKKGALEIVPRAPEQTSCLN